MSDSNENQTGFVVKDKRRFSESGDLKNGESEESSSTLKKDESVKDTLINSDKEEKSQTLEQQDAQAKLDFAGFLVGMYHQTLIFLGEIPHPETNLQAKNIDAARQNIDILDILEEKTKGNLGEEEEKLFSEILNNLRLLYVKKI